VLQYVLILIHSSAKAETLTTLFFFPLPELEFLFDFQ
jgi:hypothetical protein